MQREWIHINVVLRVNEKQESNFKKHHKQRLQVLMHYNDNQDCFRKQPGRHDKIPHSVQQQMINRHYKQSN